jgi:7-cyano-7-deazaguanine synthase
MTKTQVVAEARRLGVPVDLTWSCYAPRDGEPCGECLACETRARAGA